MGDKQTQPEPADVPALNAHLAQEPLRVTLDVAQEGKDYSVGTVTEFVAQGFEVLARIRFSDRTVKAPASLLIDEDGESVFGQVLERTAPEAEVQTSETEGSQDEVKTEQAEAKAVTGPENTGAVPGPAETVAVSAAPEDKNVPAPPQNKAVTGPAQTK